MSDDPRRTGVCTPRCYRQCQCSRWLDYLDRWGNPVNHGQDETTPPLPCYYLTFDGANDRITLAGVAVTPPYTVVAWTKRHAAGDNHMIASGGASLYLYVDNANKITMLHNPGSCVSSANATIAWCHIATTVPVGPATVATFRDGVDVSVILGPAAAGAQSWTLIGNYGVGGFEWDGELAAIAIAPSVLNIPALWAAGTLHRPLDPAVFTTACWNARQEGGAGATLIDEAIGNNGTFLGAGEPAWGGLMSVGGPAGWTD